MPSALGLREQGVGHACPVWSGLWPWNLCLAATIRVHLVRVRDLPFRRTLGERAVPPRALAFSPLRMKKKKRSPRGPRLRWTVADTERECTDLQCPLGAPVRLAVGWRGSSIRSSAFFESRGMAGVHAWYTARHASGGGSEVSKPRPPGSLGIIGGSLGTPASA